MPILKELIPGFFVAAPGYQKNGGQLYWPIQKQSSEQQEKEEELIFHGWQELN